ncbi:hypothetical protein D4R52_01615 [bacterium]|nr:MAG: hypothetical protein D4R52_01615 [bacterium]
MPIPTHLIESAYPKAFPPTLDQFPTVINEEHYIDAWILNSAFNSLLAIEQYLINRVGLIETLWDVDENGDLMPSLRTFIGSLFDLDTYGGLMPSTAAVTDAYFELDISDDIEPVT